MRLSWARAGQRLRVEAVAAPLWPEARRLGVVPGSEWRVMRTLSNGPVVLGTPAGEVTVGPRLADGITVEVLPS